MAQAKVIHVTQQRVKNDPAKGTKLMSPCIEDRNTECRLEKNCGVKVCKPNKSAAQIRKWSALVFG